MTEQVIQSKIINYLESLGGYVVKVVAATKSGVPDIICCLRGRFIALEIKRPNKKHTVTALQKVNIRRVHKAGGLAYVVSSVEEVDQILRSAND